MKKKAVIVTGVTGQDGSYLSELLLHRGYDVFGIIRRSSVDNLSRIAHIADQMNLLEGDITDAGFINQAVDKIRPIFIFNLAAQSHVKTSFSCPEYTFNVNTVGVLNILEAVRNIWPTTKVYQASTSEMFGNSPAPQSMESRFDPRSPYGVAKLAAHELVKVYRDSYGIYASSGILFNHESPRRGEKFVTRKITKAFAEIIRGERDGFALGNIKAKRDWGFAPEYVGFMVQHMENKAPSDFILGTGETHSVEDFLDEISKYSGIDWRKRVTFSHDLERPSEVHELRAVPTYQVKTKFADLVKVMLDFDTNAGKSSFGYSYFMDNYGKIFSWV